MKGSGVSGARAMDTIGIPPTTTATPPTPPAAGRLSGASPTAPGIAVAAAALLCSVALLGWLLDVRALASFVPGRPTMSPMSALALLLACAALLGLHSPRTGLPVRRLSALQVAIGGVICAAHLLGVATVDSRSPWSWSSQITGMALAVSGLSTWLLATARLWQGQLLAFVTLLTAVLIGMGHLFPHADLYGRLPGHGVAIPTILSFIALSIAQLLSFMDLGITAALTRRNAAGRTGLRLIGGGLVVPLLIGLLLVLGLRQQRFDAETAVVLMAWGAMVLLCAALWALAVAVDRAEQAELRAERQRNSLRQMMAAALTHDLRSPLQAASLSAALLERLTTGDTGQTAVRRIQQNHQRIDRLLRALLDSLTLESGQPLALRPTRVNLRALVQEVIDEHQGRLAGRVLLQGDAPEGWWDREALWRVVENLLLNALKYGQAGQPIVCRLGQTEGGLVSIDVINHGVPIPPSEWEAIFRPFERGQAARGSDLVGWGIGLAYARAVLQRHGGSIAVAHSDERGTAFAVQMPVDAREAVGTGR